MRRALNRRGDIFAYGFSMSVIQSNQKILGGTPCFAGTRVPVASLFDHIRLGYTISQFIEQFPTVKREQVEAVLELVKHDTVIAGLRRAG